MNSIYADVILPVPFESFTYLVPQALEGGVKRGCRVVVPLGKTKVYTGVVLNTHSNRPEGVEVKAIIELLDEQPVVNEMQFRFWQWIASYYMCPLGDVMKAALPGALKKTATPLYPSAAREDWSGVVGMSLSAAQSTALSEIEASFAKYNATLLHGVTSSGKTEVYIHLIDKYIREGKQVLYLLPEIALTTQITDRLRRVFGDAMGVYHSKFTDKQRLEVYGRQASDAPYPLILGVRSSVFLPFQNLGLVIIDEEHEQSYKQQEPAPRYHARSAALMLATMFGAKTLLGTATPSFETYHLAHKNRYGYVQLTQRYRDLQLPQIEIVDTKEAKRKRQMRGVFSPRLREVMREALDRKEQIILFQNRRGFSSFIECKQCGWVPRCPHCDVSLTLHKRTQALTCHYCGYSCRIPEQCPACEEASFVEIGTGTERVEDKLQEMFPDARVLRMDLDTASTRKRLESIIADFSAHEADILVGTQMVTKGLDFDRVSVVGILDADKMLNIPDFRSYEHAFQTLSQVAGRAGRKQAGGRVILQTRSADSDIIAQITQNDYWSMFYTQMLERQTFCFPPFCRLIYIYLRHRDDELLEHLADEMASHLRAVFAQRVLGPDRPPVSRIQSMYIRKIVMKIEPTASVERVRQSLLAIQQQMLAQPVAKNLNIYYDVDPV